MKPKSSNFIFGAAICMIFLAVSCNQNKPNDLQRPKVSTTPENPNSTGEDNGQVAGTETIILPTKQIKVENLDLTVEVADTDASREQGLSGRSQLADGTGMLFDFTNTGFTKPGFWMKDMLIPIDIIWINKDKIIGVEANAPLPPEDDDLPVYYPASEITHVLEVPAGWFKKNNLKIGDTVAL
jgi:uncharacterized membrane protein (UPF0127 family)